MTYLFPTVQITLMVAASAVFACGRNWKMTLYWVLAASITYVVTFMKD